MPGYDHSILDGRPRQESEGTCKCPLSEAGYGLALNRVSQLSNYRVRNPTVLVRELATRMQEHRVRPEIEIFDLSHIHGARRLIEEGLMDSQPHVQFVMGVQNAMPADEHLLDVLLGELKRVLPDATWTAAGIGRHQTTVMNWALARGANAVRTGLEDNIRISKGRLANSNGELVALAARICTDHNTRPATPQEARASLGLSN